MSLPFGAMCIQYYPNHFIAIPFFNIGGAFDAVAIKDDRRVCDIIVATMPKEEYYVIAVKVDQNTPIETVAKLIDFSGVRTGTLKIQKVDGECVTLAPIAAYCYVTLSDTDPALRPLKARADFAYQAINGNLRLTHN
ncbi:MAG: hypothetical protein LBI39_01605 [Puniceicoccales bacterium]|nr:hypothetical protein [Puniceicoccales bacterium]